MSIETCKKFIRTSLMDGRRVIASNRHIAVTALKSMLNGRTVYGLPFNIFCISNRHNDLVSNNVRQSHVFIGA